MSADSERMRQMTLQLPHRPALGREDFIVTPSNQEAVTWIDAWPKWPSVGLVLYGPKASGKTHLSCVWQAKSQAVRVEEGQLTNAFLTSWRETGRCLVVESAERIRDDQLLFHLHNICQEQGLSILLIAQQAPSLWPVELADWRSRLLALPAAAIQPPDDLLLTAVIQKLFSDRQIRVEPNVIDYLVQRLERSFAAAQKAVEALDAAALTTKRTITTALVREVLFPGAES
ncbi:MAG: DnaA/Hda family protein [Dongiaceae bacterium]